MKEKRSRDQSYSYYDIGDSTSGRLVHGLKSMKLDTGSLFDLSYTYDPLGNVTEVVDGHSTALGDCNTSLSDCDDASATYDYDVRNRLSSWTRTAGGTDAEHFAYDTLLGAGR